MSNYSSIYKLLNSIDSADNTTNSSGINPFSPVMYNNGVTYYNSTTNKVSTDSNLTFESSTLTTPSLNSTSSITTPNLTTSNNITTSGLTILNNDINITGISSSSTRRLKIVGSTSHNLSFGFDFGNFLTAETGNKSFDFYKYSFTSGECALCIYNPDNVGNTIRHKLFGNSGKNNFLCNDETSQLIIGSGTSTSNYAQLELKSTTKGLLLPRLTDSQITTLESGCTSAETGLTIYDSTNTALKIFNGSTFQTIGGSTPNTYFRTLATGNTVNNTTVQNVFWNSTTLQFNSSNWTSPIVQNTVTNVYDRITFPTTGIYLIGGCVSVFQILYHKCCNLGISFFNSLSSNTASSNQNLVSMSGSSSDKPRPSFNFLANITSTSTSVSIFVFQDSGYQQSILSESYVFAYRVA